MTEEENREAKEKLRLWVETWKKAGPELAAIKKRELRNYRYEDHLQAIDSLLEMGARFGKRRTTSGMVEMQRLFGKVRK